LRLSTERVKVGFCMVHVHERLLTSRLLKPRCSTIVQFSSVQFKIFDRSCQLHQMIAQYGHNRAIARHSPRGKWMFFLSSTRVLGRVSLEEYNGWREGQIWYRSRRHLLLEDLGCQAKERQRVNFRQSKATLPLPPSCFPHSHKRRRRRKSYIAIRQFFMQGCCLPPQQTDSRSGTIYIW